jgi:hypothetical protein
MMLPAGAMRAPSAFLWKNRQLRQPFCLRRARDGLATAGFPTELGNSAWALHGLVRSLHPETRVEIGSAGAGSTCRIALGLKEDSGVAVFHDTTWGLPGLNRPDTGAPPVLERPRWAGHPVSPHDRDDGPSLVQPGKGGLPLAHE